MGSEDQGLSPSRRNGRRGPEMDRQKPGRHCEAAAAAIVIFFASMVDGHGEDLLGQYDGQYGRTAEGPL